MIKNNIKGQVKFICLIFIAFLGIFPMFCVAQSSSVGSIPDWQKKISKVLRREKSSDVLKDSIAMYSFNFKLEITKSKLNKIKLEQLSASDDVVYQIFPDYKELYNIDYSSLMKNRNKINLIIPILVYNVSESGISEYQRQGKQPVVSIESAIAISQNSLNSIVAKNKFENMVLLNPVVIKILNLSGKRAEVLKINNKIE